MNIESYFTPVDIKLLSPEIFSSKDSLFYKVEKYSNIFPSLEKTNIIVFGICDGNGSLENHSCSEGPDVIRKKLYSLKQSKVPYKIADLGNLNLGITVEQTYQKIREVCSYLMKKNIIPVILGGSHNFTLGQYYSYQDSKQLITVLNIDCNFGMEEEENGLFKNHILKLLLHDPNYLFSYSHLAYQSYLVNFKEIETMERLNFDSMRIGEIKQNISLSEPIIRSADMISFDISAISIKDAPGNFYAPVFGLSSEESCQLSWYAGLSEKCSSFGIYEYNPLFDNRSQTASLIATMIWYFMEGYYHRKNEFDFNSQHFHKFTCSLKGEPSQIVFYKNSLNEKWWMEIPIKDALNRFRKSSLIACTYNDYQETVNGNIPDRWFKSLTKIS